MTNVPSSLVMAPFIKEESVPFNNITLAKAIGCDNSSTTRPVIVWAKEAIEHSHRKVIKIIRIYIAVYKEFIMVCNTH